jgi:hypothetical protein
MEASINLGNMVGPKSALDAAEKRARNQRKTRASKDRKGRHGRQVQFEQPLGRKPFCTENRISFR